MEVSVRFSRLSFQTDDKPYPSYLSEFICPKEEQYESAANLCRLIKQRKLLSGFHQKG